jgi:hypothetical protein
MDGGMAVDFLPSQIGSESSVPLSYTSSSIKLLCSDLSLSLRSFYYIPGMVLPLTPWRSGKRDELYPYSKNLKDIAVHVFLFFYQIAFIVSLPFCLMVPVVWLLVYVSAAFILNYVICRAVNGGKTFLESNGPMSPDPRHESEHWIFINGIATG